MSMNTALEYKKIRRTGIIPGCLLGGCLAAFIPILELAVRSEQYTNISQQPLSALLQADWQMMAMLNMLLVITVACMMYHTEYTENAIQRITTLPVREEGIFLGKFILLSLICAVILTIEMVSLMFCTMHWFGGESNAKDLFQNFGYFFCMLLPVAAISLLFASVCRNMWISLGIDVVCVFLATMIPVKYFALSIFPFALPFQILGETQAGKTAGYLIAALVEILLVFAAEMIFLKVRRSLT